MKRIIASRGTGKSTELLKTALRENGNIAVYGIKAAEHFALIARDIGISDEEIKRKDDCVIIRNVVVAPFRKYFYEPRGFFAQHKKLYIDELESCLNSLPHTHNIDGYTISLEGLGDMGKWD